MTPALARQIAQAEGALRSTIADLSLELLTGGDNVRALIQQARGLADELTETVFQLDDEEQRPVLRHAVSLAAALASLERDAVDTSTH